MKIRLRFNSWSPRVLGVEAITLYPWILIRYSREGTSGVLIKHEMIHVGQVRCYGFLPFYLSYFIYYVAGLVASQSPHSAYRAIPFEALAYAMQSRPLTIDELKELQGQWP